VIDDEYDLANLFGEFLKSGGYEVDVFTDSSQALEKIESAHQSYALVLTDVRMPIISGVDLGKKVLEIDNKIKVILISAFELIDGTEFQFIKKPIELTKLSQFVRNKLDEDV
jgi:DNA-binding NtrC family response regulator